MQETQETQVRSLTREDPKVLRRRKWWLTPVFLPGKSHEQRSLADDSQCGSKSVGHNLATKQQQNPKAMLPNVCLSNVLSELTLCGAKRSLQLSPNPSPHNSCLLVLSWALAEFLFKLNLLKELKKQHVWRICQACWDDKVGSDSPRQCLERAWHLWCALKAGLSGNKDLYGQSFLTLGRFLALSPKHPISLQETFYLLLGWFLTVFPGFLLSAELPTAVYRGHIWMTCILPQALLSWGGRGL